MIDRSKHDRRLAMYRAGATDKQIAEAEGIKTNSIVVWRSTRALPVNQALSYATTLSAEASALRFLLYSLGWSDRHIARELSITRRSVIDWRQARKLPANFPSSINESRNPRPTIADLVAKCRRSVGRYLPRDIAEDAVSDIMLDLMHGKLAIDKIGDAAKKYGNSVVKAFADKWGNRSLDVDLGDSEGFTLLDTIADDSASSWLEEMGATVW